MSLTVAKKVAFWVPSVMMEKKGALIRNDLSMVAVLVK